MSPERRGEDLRAAASRVLAVVSMFDLLSKIKREWLLPIREYELLESALERLETATSEADNA